MDWLRMTAADLGRGIGGGRIDPVALAEAYLDAIEAAPEAALIYARTTPDRALAEAVAAAARARDGVRRGVLDGVPVAWKDLFDSAGVATESGSALLAGRVPAADAAVLASASRQGLVCLGKTHMTELAFSGLGVNPVTATPPNVNDAGAAPGGSSSGSAAAVAFGLAAAGIGSDTGGSVRVPAAWNDLVGFKASHGALPMAGVVPLCPRFDTLGPLCRSVEDAALLYAVLGGGVPVDLAGARVAGARLMILDDTALGETREGPRAAFEVAVERLAAVGATIVRAAVPAVAKSLGLAPVLFAPEAYGTWREAIEAAPEKMFAPVRERFRAGETFAAVDYVAGCARLGVLRAEWAAATAGCDAVLMPSVPILPPPVARLLAEPEFFAAENLLTLRNTRVGNLMGLCALTLPTGVASCGLMAMAPAGEERGLLRLGAGMERALG